jgi:hypothetical protein
MHRHISRVAREFQRGVDVKTQPPAAVPARKAPPRPRPAKARA